MLVWVRGSLRTTVTNALNVVGEKIDDGDLGAALAVLKMARLEASASDLHNDGDQPTRRKRPLLFRSIVAERNDGL